MPEEHERKKYCPGCGTTVPYYTMVSAEGDLDRCQYCSSVLNDEGLAAPGDGAGRVYVVEDTALIREMVKDILLAKGLADDVKVCVNGADFVKSYTNSLIKEDGPGLVMLDVVMPVMNGINAAVAMRAVESAFGVERTPVVFFTVRQCDDSFRKVLKFCSPAMYINKGTDATPELMKQRVEKVAVQVLNEIGRGV